MDIDVSSVGKVDTNHGSAGRVLRRPAQEPLAGQGGRYSPHP